MFEGHVYHVTLTHDGKWAAQLSSGGDIGTYKTRDEALTEAKRQALQHAPGQVVVHRADGSVEDQIVYDAREQKQQGASRKEQRKQERAVHAHEPQPSKFTIGGHPIHPMLVPFPITFLIMLPVADAIFWGTADVFWRRAALYLLVAGVASGGLAALGGLVDFTLVSRVRRHRAGWYHLLINAGVLGLAIVNLLLRTGQEQIAIIPSGFILSLVTAGLLVAGGWFGNELIIRHKISVRGHD